MATENNIQLVPYSRDVGNAVFRNASKSFTSSAGDNASFVAVPSGETWVLQTLRALNGEGSALDMKFLLTDGDGVEHAVLSNSAFGETNVPAGDTLAWNGKIIVPATWRIYAKWLSMAGGSTCNWQYTAIMTRSGTTYDTIL